MFMSHVIIVKIVIHPRELTTVAALSCWLPMLLTRLRADHLIFGNYMRWEYCFLKSLINPMQKESDY